MDDMNSILLKCLHNITKYGKRSNMRVLPLHHFIGETISSNMTYEKKLNGVYTDKNVDFYDEQTKTVYEIKFITGNYKQNANNYFENMLGATANLKLNGYRVVQIIVLPKYLPYYDKNGVLKKIEYITSSNIMKYKNIMNLGNETKPDNMLFYFIDTGNEKFLQENIDKLLIEKELDMSYNIKSISCLNENIDDFLNEYSNFDNFIKKEREYATI